MILLSMLVCSVAQGASPSSGPPSGHPLDYFPLKVGMSWTYTVTLPGKRMPIQYVEVAWPQGGDRASVVARRGYFSQAVGTTPTARLFNLTYRVKRFAPQQGRFSRPMAVEVELVEDGLGFFRDCSQIFLVGQDRGGFVGEWLLLFDPAKSPGALSFSMGAWGTWGAGGPTEAGFSFRTIFFAEAPQTRIQTGRDPVEDLLFVGVEKIPEAPGTGLRFTRRVKHAPTSHRSENPLPFDEAFSEDMWFAKGQGLVRLVQTVDGEITMVWKLARIM